MRRRLFFIFGAPRSGTTMLQLALSRRSRVAIPPETNHFTLLTRSRRGQRLPWHRLAKDWKIEVDVPRERLRPGPAAGELFVRVAESDLDRIGRTDVTHFGEKPPEHQRRVPAILETFPDAKPILICRDGRDVALSLSKAPWMPPDLDLNFAVWLRHHRVERRLLRDVPERLHRVRYEDLVRDPEAHLRRVVEFLDLDYEPQVAAGNGNREGAPEHEYSYKSNAFAPITDGRIGNWRRELTRPRVARLERWGRSALLESGYGLVTGGTERLPAWYPPAVYGRISAWFAARTFRAKMDEYFGTGLDFANRTLHATY